MRGNTQRRGVIHAGKRKLAADHVGIAQLGMQLGLGRHRQIVGRITAGRIQPALVGRYRLLNPPAGLVLLPLHEDAAPWPGERFHRSEAEVDWALVITVSLIVRIA